MQRIMCAVMVSVMALSSLATFHHHSHDGDVHTVIFALGHLNNRECMQHDDTSSSNASCNHQGHDGQDCEFSTQLQKPDKPTQLTSLPDPQALQLLNVLAASLPGMASLCPASAVDSHEHCRCASCIGMPLAGSPGSISRRGPPQA